MKKINNDDQVKKVTNIYLDFRAIEQDLKNLSLHVSFEEHNYKTTSAEIKKITLAACATIETAFGLIEEKRKKKKDTSTAEHIKQYMKNAGYNLEEIAPKIHKVAYEPWAGPLHFWDAYNAYKHPEKDQNNCNLKSAIDSVTALFCLVVFLSSDRSYGFWTPYDFILIATEKNRKSASFYNQNKSLRNLIWPNPGSKN